MHLKPSESTITDQKSSSPLLHRVLMPKASDGETKNALQTPPKPLSTFPLKPVDEEYELLTPNKTKTLTLKKKNSLMAKRRKICLKTLEISDIQGHLFRRIRDKHGASYWEKLYFVLVETVLYGFRSKKSTKANCMIFLPGFTISLAKEVHSKQFAYKVYHPKKTFYFAAESEQALSQWMDFIKRATLKGSMTIDPTQIDRIDTKDLFSETDTSDDEGNLANEAVPQTLSFKQSFLSGYKMSGKKRGSVDDTSPTPHVKSEKSQFWSLKKTFAFTSSKSDKEREEKERKKAEKSDVPVPTSRYRSYRKIPGNAGMQVGSSTMQMDYNLMAQMAPQPNISLQPLPKHSPIPPESMLPKLSDTINSVRYSPNTSCNTIHSNSPLLPPSGSFNSRAIDSSCESSPSSTLQSKHHHIGVKTPQSKLAKTKTMPFNYMHASNPNLVEFTFQTSKTLDIGLPKVNASNAFDPHQNPHGLMTLMDLMLQCEEDESHNMYNNRVNLGVEKQADAQSKRKPRPSNDSASAHDENENTPQNGQKTGFNKIQSRSLPKTPDYAQSFKTDDSEIIMARSKEGQKLRDFGYEFISGDDMNSTSATSQTTGNGSHNSSASGNNGHSSSGTSSAKSNIASLLQPAFLLPSKRKGLNWIGLSSDKRHDEEKLMSKGSFKLIKNKSSDTADSNRSGKSDNHRPILNRFVANKSDNSSDALHLSPSQNNQSSSQPSDSPSAASTYSERKNSSATSYLSKLSFSASKTAKEKRLLGSPRLHRAASSLFGRKSSENANAVDHESVASFDTMQSMSGRMHHVNDSMAYGTHPTTNDGPYGLSGLGHSPHFMPIPPSPRIPKAEPNIEYPSPFEPEPHSLNDPNASLRLLRRRTSHSHNNVAGSSGITSTNIAAARHLNAHNNNSNDNNNNPNNGYYHHDGNRDNTNNNNNAGNNAASNANNSNKYDGDDNNGDSRMI